MAQDIFAFTVTIPVSGSAAAPNRYPLAMPSRIVTAVEIMIPSGNRGAVKFALGMAGTPIIPSNAGQYLTGDDETIHWDLSGFPDSGAWQLFAYNDGTFSHLLQIRFLTNLPAHPGVGGILQPLALTGLSG